MLCMHLLLRSKKKFPTTLCTNWNFSSLENFSFGQGFEPKMLIWKSPISAPLLVLQIHKCQESFLQKTKEIQLESDARIQSNINMIVIFLHQSLKKVWKSQSQTKGFSHQKGFFFFKQVILIDSFISFSTFLLISPEERKKEEILACNKSRECLQQESRSS